MNVKLVLVKPRDKGNGRSFALQKAKTTIGRETDCDLQIPAASVSRHHCEIESSDERVVVRDGGSSNGTFVNQQRVQGEIELEPGDTLAIGPAAFRVVINGKSKPANARPAAATPPASSDDSGSIDLDQLDAVDDIQPVDDADNAADATGDPLSALEALTKPRKVNLPSPKPSGSSKDSK